VLLLPSLTSKGKGVKLNASLAHSKRISALDEVEKGEEGTSRLREEALRELEASLPLSERPIEREAVNQLRGLGLLVSEGCSGKAYEWLSFDGRSVAGQEELIPDGSSSSSVLLAASLQLSSKRWYSIYTVKRSSRNRRIRRRCYNLILAESKFKNLMLDHQDKYMMKAQVHVSKSSAISDEQALPRRKHYCQIYQIINFTSGVK
nr:hypothetical protein [Tanacetum cinerariifolium]